MKRTTLITALLLSAILLAGCSGQYRAVSHAALLDWHEAQTYQNLRQLAEAYALTINAAEKADTIHPGLLADYGVAMAMLGEEEEANRAFNREISAFPQSRTYVEALKRRYVPDFINDHSVGNADTIDLTVLRNIVLDSITAERVVPHAGRIIDSTDTVRISAQTPTDSVQAEVRLTANQKRERLAAEQAEAERIKREQAETKAQAKLDREKAKKEADNLKKQQKKDKDKARKAEQKRRDKERKQLQQQREKERQAAAKAKEEQKQAAAKAKERQRKEAAEAKEAEKRAADEVRRAQQKAQKQAEQEAAKAQREAEKEAKAAEKRAADEARKAQKEAAKQQQTKQQ
ncbi:MAG: DUF4810 domain-containing protein [Bacteroidales bacterium]|nr:DUF4810 domain-containing protein [Bacteroidales bacterium]